MSPDLRPGPASLWRATVDGPPPTYPPLPGDRDADVVIVGAGYTGLWTAYYLAEADPSLRIVVLDKEYVGFGASGRNGGWCSAIYPASMRRVSALAGRDAAIRMQRAMNGTVLEVGAVAEAEGIECGFRAGGYASVARNEAQLARSQAEAAGWAAYGMSDQLTLLGQVEASNRVRATGVLGGTYTPHCAALQPFSLVVGLGTAVARRGVTIHEGTEVIGIEQGRVTTTRGVVRADVVVRATEGFTPTLPGVHRSVVPMYSLMVATEPFSDDLWGQIGLAERETFSDKRHLRIYGQRTADGRIAFGGRGAPYHWGSSVRPEHDVDDRVHAMLRRILVELFPALGGVRFTHAWGGNLGIPRDWTPSVTFDAATGLAQAGGYVGDGVATANLAGRMLRDAILRTSGSELLDLPLYGHRSRAWEPEPLRWTGVNAVTALFSAADRTEARTGRPSRAAARFWRTLGH
ncbi:NAD(P)/FAD-dependent oxidoreductase [Longivirga aurantiaca]|uniref:NAD(P)/FAD-dependent oxidoreductase n=1 Tax=Longivirga aurantiaca TaxID=1837743 RepID=A0ABW1SYZ9_9ACTN